jgi:parvulin-like peptidyl-prolyl isomerase
MTGPHNLNLPDAFTRIAFQLTPQEPIVPEPVTGEDGVYVLAFKRRIPSELQPLDSIRDQVTKDFTSREGFRLMREAATEFLSKATNVVASGGQLEPIAQQSGLQVVDLGPVLREGREAITNLPPVVDSGALRSAAADLKPGQLSSFVPTGNGGFIVLLEKTVPPGEEEIKEELPNFLVEYRRRNSVQAFNDWFSKEMQLARVTIAGEKDDAMTQ